MIVGVALRGHPLVVARSVLKDDEAVAAESHRCLARNVRRDDEGVATESHPYKIWKRRIQSAREGQRTRSARGTI